jgi:ornithine cyclodeaminase/alanine dehydrogenase-like protein (mu-crystallin family)
MPFRAARPDGVRAVADTLPAVTALPPLRYLTGADVAAAMPLLPERLALAEQTLRGLAGGAELPPKIGVHPRPAASFAHAMPALLPGDAADGSADRVGMKWVSGNPANNAAGLLGIYGVLVLNDPVTTAPIAILDAGPITAERTAAISGVAIRAFAPRVAGGGVPRAALIGAGVQGRSHVPVLGYVLPGVTLTVFDRDPVRAGALAALARETPGIGEVRQAASAREAIEGAGVVVTVASFVAPPDRQVMTNDWLAPDTLVVPVDYATYCAAEVARDASLFTVDHVGQFLANREMGNFDGYPDPAAMTGEVLDLERPAGRVVTIHLGTGLADVVFGSAILAEALSRGMGTILPR